jgi:2-amino-4-hydroxy-6-hydroxymethyldihydropteridine diphosphokinase
MSNHSNVTAYIALGSNLGDRAHHLLTAISKLSNSENIALRRVSSILDNPAVGGPTDAPPFLNCAVEIQTSLGSHNLLHHLLEIEKSMGRARKVKWEPRMIDLDLLLYGEQIISSHELVIPHPLMHERRFVIQPLAEIAPNAVHPVLQMTMAGLLESLTRQLGK